MHLFIMSTNHRQSVLYEIRNRIVTGELTGGAKLRASHLSEEMGVSRTPISEALLKLEGEGLLIGDKSGYTVRSFSMDEVFDAIDLRGLLEASAVQKAAERGVNEEELSQLRNLVAEMDDVVTSGAMSEYDTLNEDFHLALIESSKSKILIEEVKRSYRFPFAGPSAFPMEEDYKTRFQNSVVFGQEQHHQILDAIQNREGARAFAIMREHARLAHANLHAALKDKDHVPQLALVRG